MTSSNSPNDWYILKCYRNISRWIMKKVKSQNLKRPPFFPKVELQVGVHRIIAEVASTKNTQEYGLMFRKQLPENHGMLFVFEKIGKYCFFMKNTSLPLSIAFLKKDGSIIQIYDMQPYSLDKICTNKSVRYALEMNQGWFAKKNANIGTKIINKKYFN